MVQFKIILATLFLTQTIFSQNAPTLQTSTPEKQGIVADSILSFLNAIDTSQIELHSFMLVRHGKIVINASWSPYDSRNKHIQYSITKSFASTAIGFAVDEKLLYIDDKVASFFPEWANDKPYWNELTVKHLLTMSIGQHAEGAYADPIALAIEKNDDWVKIFFNVPILHRPGSRFLYNTLASHVLSAIVEKVTKMSTADYLNQKLFKPLGITDFDWEVSPTKVNTGGWGLRLTTEGMAKIGQFFLQKGRWQGKQILSEKWIAEATSFKIAYKNPRDTANEWSQGYGYQWWLYRKGIFAAQGSEGQSIIVLPEQDAVIAITANLNGRQSTMNLIRTILIPAMTATQLPKNKARQKALQQRLAALKHLPPTGIASKQLNKSFKLAQNPKGFDSISINCGANECVLQLKTQTTAYNLSFGKEKWQHGITPKKGPYRMHSPTTFEGLPPFKVAGSYTWTDDNTLKLTLRYLESPHFETFVCHFDNDSFSMEIISSMNVVNKYKSAQN